MIDAFPTEADEIAAAILASRRSRGLHLTVPIRTYADAERVAKHECPDQGATATDSIAEALWAAIQRGPFKRG